MRNRWIKRRAEAVTLLGGKCVKCGQTESLEFDHIDPLTKINTIAKMSSFSNQRFSDEIAKCQLLCKSCHEEKTLKDLGQISAKLRHGTITTYTYCRCTMCKAAKSAYAKEYMKTYVRKRDRNSMVENLTFNQYDGGSSPSDPTN